MLALLDVQHLGGWGEVRSVSNDLVICMRSDNYTGLGSWFQRAKRPNVYVAKVLKTSLLDNARDLESF
eukprot:5449505-Amphidinium_carterae.1